MLTLKAKEEFDKWFREKRATSRFRFWMLLETEEVIMNATIIEWFDTVGITIDVIPRVLDSSIVFEPNTICLKYDVVTEDFTHFKSRQEAVSAAITQANNIFNTYMK